MTNQSESLLQKRVKAMDEECNVKFALNDHFLILLMIGTIKYTLPWEDTGAPRVIMSQ